MLFKNYLSISNFFPLKEKFDKEEEECENKFIFLYIMIQIFLILLIVFSINLAWKCNGNKFDFIHMFVAILYPPIYIAYQFIVNNFSKYVSLIAIIVYIIFYYIYARIMFIDTIITIIYIIILTIYSIIYIIILTIYSIIYIIIYPITSIFKKDNFLNSKKDKSLNSNIENFGDTLKPGVGRLFTVIIGMIVPILLSYRCNNGFNIIDILLAIVFQPFYIIYHLYKDNLCGIINW